MPTILYVITRSEPGGAQVHLLHLLKAVRQIADVALATGEEGFLADRARDFGVPVHVLDHLVVPIRPMDDARQVWGMRQLLSRLRPDLVHLHSSKAGMIGRIAARLAGVPTVFTAHGWAFTDGVPLLRRIVAVPSEWAGARLGGRIIAVSRNDFDIARKYRIAPPESMTVIHNGVSDTNCMAAPGRRGVPTLVMVARFGPQKDHALLLRALAGMECDFRLQLVGDGPLLDETMRLSVQLGLRHQVTFEGVRQDVEKVLSRAQILVLTSNYEGFPISIVEAMRAGLPVIASNVGGVREAVREGENGFLIPRGDVVALRQKLRLLIADSELRGQMGRAARRCYERHFTAEQMVNKTIAVYEKATGMRGAFNSPQRAIAKAAHR